MGAWTVAESLNRLLAQLNAYAPHRSKVSDGSIGDADHASRSSDHNPWLVLDGQALVSARDFTHDPDGGIDCFKLRDALIRARDSRVKYCLVPDTRVLQADLTWAAIETLHPGSRLIAFDEHGSDRTRKRNVKGHAGAKMRTAIVEAAERITRPCYEIVTDRATVIASEDHLWLQARAYQDIYRRWTATSDLAVGDQIQYFADPWEPQTSFDAGWLAGLFDGEGCLSRPSQGGSWMLSLAQREGPVFDRAVQIATDLKLNVATYRNSSVMGLHIRGGLPEILRTLGVVPTTRLYSKAAAGQIWDGHGIMGRWPLATVRDIRPVGDREVIALQTSTRTLIAEGLFSHNCIFNRQIISGADGPQPWKARRYSGTNPHTKHLHLSVVADRRCRDDSPWMLPGLTTAVRPSWPTIRRGDTGTAVGVIQRFLGVQPVDEQFGPATEAAVRRYQNLRGLAVDGICGQATWQATGL